MSNIGFSELFLLTVLVIFLFGPEKIPEFIRKVKAFIHEFNELKNEANRSVNKLNKELFDEDLQDDTHKKDRG